MIEIIIGIAAGGILPIQTALGAKLRKVLKSPLRGALANFLVASVFLALILTCSGHGLLIDSTLLHTQPWWIWTCGLFGAVFVLGNAFLAALLGTGLTVSVVLFGQIACSTLIEQFGWLDAQRRRATAVRFIGLLMLFAGVLLIKLA